MTTQLTPAKRLNDDNHIESDGKDKLQKTRSSREQPLRSSLESVNFRMLCPTTKVDRVFGEAGAVIAQIHEETGFGVRIEEGVAGCDERVVVIERSRKDKDVNVGSKANADGGSKSENKEVGDRESNASAPDDDKKESSFDRGENDALCVDEPPSANGNSAMKALLFIFERFVEAETDADGGDEKNGKLSTIILRLLVISSQVGCILGKAGSVIKLMANESGAQIRILPRDKLPLCASARDDVVQITGEVGAVTRALHLVCRKLLENPRQDHDLVPATSSGLSSQSLDHPRPRLEAHALHRVLPCPLGPPDFPEIGIQSRIGPATDVLTIRLLCPDGKAGVVIGKGGSMVKGLLQETGCDVKVMDPVPDCQDRVVVVSGSVHPDDRISAVQDAVLRVLNKILKTPPDNQEKTVVTRLLITSNQIGCLLGKAGSIMAEMRKSTGAYIRILPKNQIPKCASEGEEVLQINGELERVLEAILQITTRLQHNFFGDAFHSIRHPSNPAFLDQTPPFPPLAYTGRRELSPFHPFHYFNGMSGPPQRLGFPPLDDHSTFMHNIPRSGMPLHLSERKPWTTQGLSDSGAPVGFPDFPGLPHRRISGIEGHTAITTSTTVEVVVPRSIVPVIYGEDGACLMQIRQISEAKIVITDPNPGATETVIIISGSPEQTHAAQSLIQAFVMSEQESA
ncbi:KH domain-containing protein HEN4 [Linum perenne]